MAAKITLVLVLALCCASAAFAWECYGDHECHSSNPCLTPKCNKGKCEFWDKNDGCACDDGNPCTVNDKCYKGKCVAGSPKKCYTKNQCKYATCDPHKGCTEVCKPDGTKCSDGNKCTVGDCCHSGECKPGNLKTCPFKGPCYKNYCNPYSGKCKCEKLANDTPCDLGYGHWGKCCDGKCK